MSTPDGRFYSKTPSSSSTIHGFKIRTDLEYTQEGPGKTRVSWKFIATYDHNSSYPATSTKARATIKISFTSTDDSTFSEITGNSYDSGSGNYVTFRSGTEGTQKELKSGSVLVTHNENGKATFKISANVAIGGYDCDKTATFTLPDNIPYTACGAPTSVSASGIITPNGSFTINWSGATNGVSNNIKAYQVYWRITSDGAAPTSTDSSSEKVKVTEGTTSGSYTVKLSDATRGHKVVCGVKTLSVLGENYDSGIKTGGLVTINSLPESPTASVNKTVVPSTGEQVTFTVTAGKDNDSSQTKTLYYSTSSSSSSTKTKITSPWSPKVTATTKYYFWTYDGLEFSSFPSAGITITKNTKPTFDVSISAQGLASANNKSGYNYTVAPTISISNISGGQNNKKYIYKLLYGTDTSEFSSKTLYNLDTATQKTITDIRKEIIGYETNGAYYKISVQCYDGIEYSDVKNTDIRYVTKVPALIRLYNNSDSSHVDGFYNGKFATHYSKFLEFVFERDAGYDTLKFKNYDGSTKTINLNTNNSNTRGSWTNSDNPVSSTYYDLAYSIGKKIENNNIYTQEKEKKITKIGTVSLTNFKFSQENFKFFTDSGTYSGTAGHSYSIAPEEGTELKNYGIRAFLDTSSKSLLQGKIYANNKWSDPFSLKPNLSTTNNTLGFDITSRTLANAITGLFDSAQKNAEYTATIRLSIFNDFGDQSYIDDTFTIDFRSIDSMELTANIFPKKKEEAGEENIPKNNIDEWMYLKEGMVLKGNFEITSYNTNPKGEIQILRSTEANWQTLKTFTFSGNNTATPGFPATYSATNIDIQTIGEIANSNYNVNYRLIITTDAGSKTCSLYDDIPVRGHIPATLTILSNSYNDNNLTINYKFSNFGADTTNLKLGNDNQISLYTVGKDGSVSYTIKDDDINDYFSDSEKTEKTAIFAYEFGSSESSLVKLGITTSLSTYLKSDTAKENPIFKTIKTTNLDKVASEVIFNILPTIAYRKNHLGINILEPSTKSDAIIMIGEASVGGEEKGTRDTIYFKSATNNFCKIVNFLIDGGTWDKQENEI